MATATDTPTAARSVARVDSAVWLMLMIAASIVLRLVVNTRFQAPTILTDELTYSNLARQIADGQFSLSNGYGVVYPLLMAPSWAIAKFGTDAYTYMKATNAVLVSLTAIPVFLWARRMMRHGYALLAAGLTLLMPSMAYSGHIMTENAFVLFFMIAVWAIAVAVERPVILNQALLVVALALAFATRAQAIVLLPAVPLIIVLAAIAEERATGTLTLRGAGRRLLGWWPLAALTGLGLFTIVARTVLTNWHWNQVLQAYSITASGQYTASNVARYFLWHLGEATFALGVIPVAALLALLGVGILNRTRSTAERAYLCTAVVAIPLVILQVATFTSYWSQRVSERNMFCVFPIVLIGLALWLDHGVPRTRRTAGIAAAVSGALVLCVPFAFLYERAPSTETWAIVLPHILSRKLAGGVSDVQMLIVTGVTVALFIFGITRRNVAATVGPIALIAYFLLAQAAAVHEVSKAARDYRHVPSLGSDASWVDAAVPSRAKVALITGSSLGADADRVLGWETGFFNRTPLTWISWGSNIISDPLTGYVTAPDGSPPVLPEYVITPASMHFVGDTVANRGAFVLQKPSKPYRLAFSTNGIYADGWMGPIASVDVYAKPSSKVIEVLVGRGPDPPAGAPTSNVVATSGTLVQLPDGSIGIGDVTDSEKGTVSNSSPAFAFDLEVPTPPFRLTLNAQPTFAPADLGSQDVRQLSAYVAVKNDSGLAIP